MARYDRAVLQKLADQLYFRAALAVIAHVLTWGFVFGVLAHVVVAFLEVSGGADQRAGITAYAAVAGVLLGAFIGFSQAFKLRVEAQRILWMLEIEKRLDKGGK